MEHTTKQRLLDTAEELFADFGFASVSIRQIVAKAGANLAAVHYHFKSKDALLDSVVMRKATPVNEERLAMLTRFEEEAGGRPVAVEHILEAMIVPTFAVAERAPHMVRLMGRIHAEGIMARLMRTHFQPLVLRFRGALQKSLPALSQEELLYRIEFCVGALVAGLNGAAHEGLTAQKRELLVARLVAFLAAALRAPAYKPSKR
jgi:AcrR family transcriptional regulator